jgi:hypothetical protein
MTTQSCELANCRKNQSPVALLTETFVKFALATECDYFQFGANLDYYRSVVDIGFIKVGDSGVARICIWRGLGARPARPEAPTSPEAVLGWVREGVVPFQKGGSGVSPPRKF